MDKLAHNTKQDQLLDKVNNDKIEVHYNQCVV